MSTLRCFLALPASDEVRARSLVVQQALRATGAQATWDDPSKFHITLKFLGPVDEHRLPDLRSALAICLSSYRRFELTYSTVGAFPDPDHPRVVWVGAGPNETATRMRDAVETTCAALGFPREPRPFHPHITLARIKGMRNLRDLTQELKRLTFEPISSHCDAVVLMKSNLQSGGSIYTQLTSFPLTF